MKAQEQQAWPCNKFEIRFFNAATKPDCITGILWVMTKPEILIVGAGINGLIAANYQQRSGCNVTMIERAERFTERQVLLMIRSC